MRERAMASVKASSPTHWTYDGFAADPHLMQGDILARTNELVQLLSDVHAHFCDEKYLGFMVVTQSCDLVRRKGDDCKTHYITLAVIRSLNPILDMLFREFGTDHFKDVYIDERRTSAGHLVERILNQNEQSFGLFYLHPDSDAGVAEASVALLRVTIALRAEHYNLLIAARRGRLKAEFSNKLGWLIGNLYSRVATADWEDHEGNGFRQLCEDLVSKGGRRQWLPKAHIERAVKQNLHSEGLAGEAAARRIKEVAPKSQKSVAIERVREIAGDIFGDGHNDDLAKLALRLENDPSFSNACRKT
jgi:hypothetical protein